MRYTPNGNLTLMKKLIEDQFNYDIDRIVDNGNGKLIINYTKQGNIHDHFHCAFCGKVIYGETTLNLCKDCYKERYTT